MALVVVAIAGTTLFDAVQHHPNHIGADVAELLDGGFEGAEFGDAGADDEEDAIDDGGEDDGVVDGEDGGGIDEDEIGLVEDGGEDFAHFVGAEEFGGVGGELAGADDVEGVDGGGLEGAVEVDGGLDEEGAEAGVGLGVEDAVDAGAVEVGVEDGDAAPGLGEDDGEVGGDGGLAVGGGGAGNEEGAHGAVDGGVLDVGAEGAEGFGDGGAGLGAGDELAFGLVVLGDEAEDGELEAAGDFFGVAEGVIEGVVGEDAADGEHGADDGGEEGVLHGLGLDGAFGEDGLLDLDDVGEGLGFGEADLFVGEDEVGVDLLVLVEAGFEAVDGGGVTGVDEVLAGDGDLAFDFGDLLLEVLFGGGEAGGLGFLNLVGEDDDDGVGDGGGDGGVGIFYADGDELGVAHGGDNDGATKLLGGDGEVEAADDVLEDGALAHHLGVGAGDALGGHDGVVVVDLAGGGGFVDEESGGSLVDGGHLEGDEVRGGAGEEGGEGDEPPPLEEEVEVLAQVDGGFFFEAGSRGRFDWQHGLSFLRDRVGPSAGRAPPFRHSGEEMWKGRVGGMKVSRSVFYRGGPGEAVCGHENTPEQDAVVESSAADRCRSVHRPGSME